MGQETEKKSPSSTGVPQALARGYILWGHYRIDDVLGCGGFGITYAAWDTQRNIKVAVKELYPSRLATRPQGSTRILVNRGSEGEFSHIFSRFREEALQLRNMQNLPGVVRVYDFFGENNTAYYVMEYLEGQDLRKHVQRTGTMTWNQLAPVMQSLMSTLHQLHKNNLIHRDISPDNIYLTTAGEVKLIDFGSVRNFQGNHSFTVYVKKNFAPIEQYQSDGKQGPWTDVYSLCVTLYYVLSGTLPPSAPDMMYDKTTQKSGKGLAPIRQICPDLPEHVAAGIEAGMALRPVDRVQSMAELAQMLFPRSPEPAVQKTETPQGNPVLICTAGYYRGYRWQISPGMGFFMGRYSRCHVSYPPNTPGVSGHQCTIYLDPKGGLLIRDENSSNGTWLDGVRLAPARWYPAKRGSRLLFSGEQFIIQ